VRPFIVGIGVAILLQISGLGINDGAKWWIPMLVLNVVINILLLTRGDE
jgi:hypothetical protein